MLNDLFVLDIETVPSVEHYSLLSEDWKSLWWEKISKIVPETTTPEDSWMQRAGILAEFGKIICISGAYFYEDDNRQRCLKVKSIYGDNEAELLKAFASLCDKLSYRNKQFRFAGHNIKEFDIPYICRRMIINHIPLPKCLQLYDRKPWEVNMLDTLSWWKFGDNKNYISLNLLAHVLGVPTSKGDMDGSMVQHVYYKEKNLPRIVDYCQRDVVATANIILRFHDLPLLQQEQVTMAESVGC